MTKQKEISLWAYDWLSENHPDLSDFKYSAYEFCRVVMDIFRLAPKHREPVRRSEAIFSALYSYVFLSSRDFHPNNQGGNLLHGIYFASHLRTATEAEEAE